MSVKFFICLTFIFFSSYGEEVPQFKSYPVKSVYKGKNHPLIMDDFGKMFRTRLRLAIKHGKPTFAGRYIVTEWGCGTGGCRMGAIIDAKTGKAHAWPVILMSVFPLKKEYADEWGQEHLYRLNSRLMIFAGSLESYYNSEADDIVEFYEFDNGEFKYIDSRPYGKHKPKGKHKSK